MKKKKYRRVLLKLSGEALMGCREFGIDPQMLDTVAVEIGRVQDLSYEVAVVIGGGNIFRGVSVAADGMDRVNADYMGMLATVMNCLALQDALTRKGIRARVMSAIEMKVIADSFSRREAIRSLERKEVVIFAAGTGHPFFTTDTTAALRAVEINADVLMKATKVDGIYSADPVKDPNAKKIPHTNYMNVLEKKLKVMDATAISLCMENHLPILVFDLTCPDNILKAVQGEPIGSLVEDSHA